MVQAIQAINSQRHADFTNVQLGYGRKLVMSMLTHRSLMTWRAAIRTPSRCRSRHAFSSAQSAAEMVELYWQAFAGDVPFAQWDTSSIIQSAASELSGHARYQGPRDGSGLVTTANIFRGNAAGCLVGPYLS
jgi:hypothetical protein